MSWDTTDQNGEETTSSTESTEGDGGGDFDPAFVSGGAKPGRSNLALVGGLLAVAAVVVWFFFFRSGPQSAQAGTAANDGGGQIKEFLDSGNINMMKQTLKETEKIVKQFRAYPGKTQVPVESLHTNPFRELDRKPDAPIAANNRDAEKAEELHKQATAAVAELHLQSIVRGSKVRACMVNNTLYKEGQQIGILKVEQVTTNSVIVSSGQYRFEVKMKE
jgi:Spy/CpxP family protein refolding chaperone